jgi:ankyrin repeat protein
MTKSQATKFGLFHYSTTLYKTMIMLLSLCGASFEAKNVKDKSVHEELLEMLNNDDKKFKTMHPFVKWWVLKITDQHWLKLFRIAAEKGFGNCLYILIENKFNVNAWSYQDGNTALHFTSENNLKEAAQRLVCKNAEVNAKNFEGNTALHIAVQKNNLDCLKFLVKHGANVNEVNKKRQSSLHLVFVLSYFSSKSCEEQLQVLLEAGADINAKDEDNNTALHAAVISKLTDEEIEKSCRILIATGADLSAKNDKLDTPLHLAAKYCNSAIVKCLLELGANVKEENTDKQTTLHSVFTRRPNRWSSKDIVECIKVLKDAGAEINAKDKDNNTLLHYSVKSFLSDEGKEESCQFLIEAGANFSAKNDDGETPLHLAAKECNNVILKCLIKEGANVNVENIYRETPLHCAVTAYFAEKDKENVCEALIEAGADMSAKNDAGQTPLHLAAKECSMVSLKCLLKMGANVNEENNDNQTPLHLVFVSSGLVSKGYVACTKLLIESGAEINSMDLHNNTPLHCAVKSDLSDENKEK